MSHDIILATEIPSLEDAVARGALLDVMPAEVRRILALVGLEGTRADRVEGLLVHRPA